MRRPQGGLPPLPRAYLRGGAGERAPGAVGGWSSERRHVLCEEHRCLGGSVTKQHLGSESVRLPGSSRLASTAASRPSGSRPPATAGRLRLAASDGDEWPPSAKRSGALPDARVAVPERQALARHLSARAGRSGRGGSPSCGAEGDGRRADRRRRDRDADSREVVRGRTDSGAALRRDRRGDGGAEAAGTSTPTSTRTPPAPRQDEHAPRRVPRRSWIEFDPLFFSVSPREAADMDPQQRIAGARSSLWEALEDTGARPASLSRSSRRGLLPAR